ncbi:MAG: hypothetical protein SO162_01330 [Candidatus Onthomorpha sp.]|nr:hypothetical protein [Candidatus Onthomorpha sp.]
MKTSRYRLYKSHRADKEWWVDELDEDGKPLIGTLMVSIDRKTVLNLWTDYIRLTNEQRDLFDKENPYWAEYLDNKHQMVTCLYQDKTSVSRDKQI